MAPRIARFPHFVDEVWNIYSSHKGLWYNTHTSCGVSWLELPVQRRTFVQTLRAGVGT